MFVLKAKATYQWPVKFSTPKGAGEHEEQDFTAVLARVPQQKLDDCLSALTLKDKIEREKALADEALIGWVDVFGVDGDTIEFNDETKAQLLAIPSARAAVVRAIYESVAGVAAKNL